MGKKPSGSPSVWARFSTLDTTRTGTHACIHTHTGSPVPLNKIPNPTLTVQTQKKKSADTKKSLLGQKVAGEEKKEIKLAEQQDIDQNHR